MKKIIIVIPIIIVVGFLIISNSNGEVKNDKPVFHVTLADPRMYQDGVYTDEFTVEPGEYVFRFVPNGDSPKLLLISLSGDNFNLNESFTLNGTLHETGISQYYTWDYDGGKKILINEVQDVTIQINPNGNFLGSVSIDILENVKQ